ncbi:hypothetical protein D9M68_687530 [compost metagenome]
MSLAAAGDVNPNKKLIYQADSSGTVFVKEGNGHVVHTTKAAGGYELIEEGDYKEGYKQGKWTGKYTSGQSSFTENYEAGKLISGESIVNGTRHSYKHEMEPPQYKGGIQAWYSYIAYSMKYPTEAVQMKIQGVVLTEFTIDMDGSITDIIIRKSVDPALDNEARRLLQKAPKWIPAKFRGVPVKVKQTQPFSFRLPKN